MLIVVLLIIAMAASTIGNVSQSLHHIRGRT